MARANNEKKFLVVGVDFGTSYTGIAYAFSDDPRPEKIRVVTEWPGVGRGDLRTETLYKVPSEISYSTQPYRWGYMFRTGMPRYGWFKLLLDRNAGERAYNDLSLTTTFDPGNPSALLSLAPGKTAIDMCADYLALIYEHTIDYLRRHVLANTFEETSIEFVLTTPGMWNDVAKHATKVAAMRAGFGSRAGDWIEMVSEPEAAAAYSLKTLNPLQAEATGGWEVGNQIIVCDAGGGTVDLVTYQIEQVKPFLKVVESVQPTGSLYGATALDRAFLHLVRERLGPQSWKLRESQAGRGSTLMKEFESLKRGFGSSQLEDQEYIEHGIGNIEPDVDRGIETHHIILSYEDIQSIFDPVVEKITGLVSTQAAIAKTHLPSKPVTGIILVGGFGESIYLFKKLKVWADAQTPPIFICNPTDSWPAIVKGAVSHGLEAIVYRRKLQAHYGVQLCEVFDPSIHNPSHQVKDVFRNIMLCNDTVTWFAAMGENTDTDRRIKVPFEFCTGNRYADFDLDLVTCNYNETPKSFRDSRVLKLPKLTVTAAGLPDYAYESRRVGALFGLFGGVIAYRGTFSLEMVFESASLRWEVWQGGRLLATHRFGATI